MPKKATAAPADLARGGLVSGRGPLQCRNIVGTRCTLGGDRLPADLDISTRRATGYVAGFSAPARARTLLASPKSVRDRPESVRVKSAVAARGHFTALLRRPSRAPSTRGWTGGSRQRRQRPARAAGTCHRTAAPARRGPAWHTPSPCHGKRLPGWARSRERRGSCPAPRRGVPARELPRRDAPARPLERAAWPRADLAPRACVGSGAAAVARARPQPAQVLRRLRRPWPRLHRPLPRP